MLTFKHTKYIKSQNKQTIEKTHQNTPTAQATFLQEQLLKVSGTIHFVFVHVKRGALSNWVIVNLTHCAQTIVFEMHIHTRHSSR